MQSTRTQYKQTHVKKQRLQQTCRIAVFEFTFLFTRKKNLQGGTGHWTVNYTGTQSFITTLSYSLAQTLGTFIEFQLVGSILVVFKPFNQ